MPNISPWNVTQTWSPMGIFHRSALFRSASAETASVENMFSFHWSNPWWSHSWQKWNDGLKHRFKLDGLVNVWWVVAERPCLWPSWSHSGKKCLGLFSLSITLLHLRYEWCLDRLMTVCDATDLASLSPFPAREQCKDLQSYFPSQEFSEWDKSMHKSMYKSHKFLEQNRKAGRLCPNFQSSSPLSLAPRCSSSPSRMAWGPGRALVVDSTRARVAGWMDQHRVTQRCIVNIKNEVSPAKLGGIIIYPKSWRIRCCACVVLVGSVDLQSKGCTNPNRTRSFMFDTAHV